MAQVSDTVSSATARFNCFNFSVETTDVMQTTRKPEFGSSISSRILNKERTFTEDITVTVPENIEETANGTPDGPPPDDGGPPEDDGSGTSIVDVPCPDIPRRRRRAREFDFDPRWDMIDGDCGEYTDPLSQTFLISNSLFGASQIGYLTSIDIFFASKDAVSYTHLRAHET